jgi:hypothetical protein
MFTMYRWTGAVPSYSRRSLATSTPQTFLVASWLASSSSFGVAGPRWGRRALRPGPYSPGLSRFHAYRGSTTGFYVRTPFRLACRARAVWQCRPVPSLSGLLPPFPASPGYGCPQLHRPAATGRRRSPFHLRPNTWRLMAQDEGVVAEAECALSEQWQDGPLLPQHPAHQRVYADQDSQRLSRSRATTSMHATTWSGSAQRS